jgi:hypothetical protein
MIEKLDADIAFARGQYEDGLKASDRNSWLQSALDLLFDAELRAEEGAEVYPDRRADFEAAKGRIRDLRKLCRDARTLEGEAAGPARRPEPPAPPSPEPAPPAKAAPQTPAKPAAEAPSLDALAKVAARDVAAKALARLQKDPQVRFRASAQSSGFRLSCEGVAWSSGCVRLGEASAPVYRRAAVAVARDRFGAWVPAADAGDEPRRLASLASFHDLLASAQRGAARARFLPDQDAAGLPCRVVEIECAPEELQAHVDASFRDGPTAAISGLKDVPFDKKDSWLRLRLFVSGDFAVRRIEREARVRFSRSGRVIVVGSSGPCDALLTLDIEKPGEAEEVPPDVKKKLGIR